jgi:hypothetical protein
MKKKLIVCLLLSMAGNMLIAQTPQHFASVWDTTNTHPYGGVVFNAIENRQQGIYYPSDFLGMPKGIVTAVYFRSYPVGSTTVENVLYNNVSVRLGYTASTNYPANGGWDTFKTALTPVFSQPTCTFTGVTVEGNWIKFKASGNWMYDPAQNTVVDIQHGIESGNNFGGFNLICSNVGAKRMISGTKDAVRTFSIPHSYTMDLGFDIKPLGVDEQSKLLSCGVFPNPSTDGHFMVSADAKQALQQVVIRVSNSVGQLVYETTYQQPGTSLFKEVVLPNASAGIYFVELLADGERLTRRVTVQ